MLQWLGRKKRVEGTVGLSLTSQRLSLAHVVRQREETSLLASHHEELGDVGVAERLASVVAEHGLQGASTNLVLTPNDYSIYLVEAPQVGDDEMASAIRWKIKDLLDMPVEDAIIDVMRLPDNAFSGRKQMIYAVASARSRLEERIAQISMSGLELNSIDIPEMVLRNVVRQFGDDTNGLAFISLRENGSTMNITRQGQLYLTRRINTSVGPDALLEPDWEMRRDRVVLEIQRSLDYFESQMGQNPVSQIMIAPRGQDTESMMNSLADALASPVGVLDYDSELELDGLPGDDGRSGGQAGRDLIMAVGAALRVDDGEASA
ncbi:hypothetical protein [Pseudohongiella nitratireducens]|uniref:hypothetical protein n=1 Tax=Pseudohongiella nitratireducens TaxID=1768907 RepID=UPI0030EF7CEE